MSVCFEMWCMSAAVSRKICPVNLLSLPIPDAYTPRIGPGGHFSNFPYSPLGQSKTRADRAYSCTSAPGASCARPRLAMAVVVTLDRARGDLSICAIKKNVTLLTSRDLGNGCNGSNGCRYAPRVHAQRTRSAAWLALVQKFRQGSRFDRVACSVVFGLSAPPFGLVCSVTRVCSRSN